MGKGMPRTAQRGAQQVQEIIKLVIPVRDLIVNVAAAGIAVGFGTGIIRGLPQGNLLFLGAVLQSSFSESSINIVDTFSGDIAIGSAPTIDVNLTGDSADIIPAIAVGPAVAGVGSVKGSSSNAQSGVIFDNTAGGLELNLNMLIDAADITDSANGDVVFNGVLHIVYIVLGDG